MEQSSNDYLKEEYFKLQDQYEDYDRRALQIKGWIGGGTIAALALGLNTEAYQKGILFIISIVALCFWYLETKWKLFQYSLSDRIRIIEAHFRDDDQILVKFKNPKPLQIYHWWFKTYSNDEPIFTYEKKNRPRSFAKRYLSAGLQTFVHLPYSLIIIICIALSILNRTGYLK